MATCTTVATTAPSHSAPNNEKATVYRKATPNSYGPAWDSAAIIQPPATKHTSPTASAATYGTTGHQNRGWPYRQVSASLPHITEPIATPIPASNGSVVEPAGSARNASPGSSAKPLTTRYRIHPMSSGATKERANAVIP